MYRLQRFRGSRLCSNKNHHPAVHDAPININVSHNIGLLRPLRANSRNSLRLHDVQLRYRSVFRNFQLCQSRATNIHHNELFAIHPINRSRPSVFPATCSIRLFSKSTAPSSTLQELPVEEVKTLNIPDLPDLSVNLSDPFITPWGESNLPPIPIVTSSRVLQQTQSTNQSKPHSVSVKNERARRSPRIVEVTQHLLSMSSSTNHTNLQQKFKHYLANARIDESLLHKLHLSQFEANNMWILPSSLLKDVHSAIMHFSKEENFQGIILPPNNHPEDVPAGGLPFENHEQKLPGPLVCARLLELIGIPNYYSSLAPPSPFSSPQHNSPKIVVHSSQIDQILESCLQTTVALSRSCKTGKHSLIGNDFSSHQNSGTSGINGGGKSAAHLAEEIWRSVWNTEIKYTSREKKVAPVGVHAPMMYSQIMQPLRIGRIGSIGMGHNPVIEYLVSARQRKNNGRENEFDSLRDNPMPGIETHATSSLDKHSTMPLSKTNQRRYDVSVMLFNSVLDAYSKLGSSSSGLRSEIRCDMVQCAERLLLEVAAKKKTFSSLEAGFTEDTSPELAPSTILQSMQPDVISFNTVMRAWSELSTRQSHAHRNNRRSNIVEEEESNSLAIAFAERTEAILEMMYELSEEGRAQQTTTQAMKSAWDKHSRYSNGGGGFSSAHHTSLSPHAGGVIAPDTTSYNILLNAWSRNSDKGAALRALDTFRKMVERCNMSCFAREALMAENADAWKETGRDKRSNTIENAFPDARTCVALLNSIHNLPSSMKFEDAFQCVESIHDYMKQWDKQMQWSNQMRVAPRCKDRAKVSRILNVFVYNTLIKTFSKLPAHSWEESYRCCQRIDELVSDMESSTSIQPDLITRGMAVYAWTKASDSIIKDDAGTYTQSLRICSDKAGLHADMLLSQMQSTNSAGSKRSDLFGSSVLPAINDAISLYGKALSPSKAEDLFLRAKKYNVYNLQILSAIVDSLAKNSFQDITYAKKAHQYLFEFEQDLMKSNPSSFAPDMKYTSMYNEIIAGFLSSDRKTEGLDHAKNLLSYMIASHESNPRHIARPNTTTFVQVMAALAQRGDHTPQLEELLRIMEELSHRRANFPKNSKDAKLAANVVPNKVVYNILLKSYARSNDSNALESATKLLHRMEKDPGIESPDSLSHSTMTTLLSRKERRESKQVVGYVGDNLIKDGVDSYKEKGEKGLPFNEKEFESSIPSFNAMMNVYTTKGTIDGAEQGAALLRKMEEMYTAGEINFKPDVMTYNKVMNAWQMCEQNNSDLSFSPSKNAEEILDYLCAQHDAGVEGLLPNDVSFSICIHSWCKSPQPDAIDRAVEILRKKEAFSKKESSVFMKITDWNTVISKLREYPAEGPDRASKLFEELIVRYNETQDERSAPTTVTLNALLDVYAKNTKPDSAEKAEGILNNMNQLYEDGKSSVLPDVISYRTCMDAWIRQRQPKTPNKVESLLHEMMEKYRKGRTDLLPDSNSFNLVLKACAHSPVMWSNSLSKGNDHPIAIANRIFTTLQKKNDFNATPTHSTYSFMFRVYKRHMDFADPRYAPLMLTLWKRCCQDGQVSKFSLEAFRESVPESQFFMAIGGRDMMKTNAANIMVDDLPREWRRNVGPEWKPRHLNEKTNRH